ncbi:MAG: glycoside hydrolase family 16 protein [Planctomycetaceae bacterium]|jgi:beta-glucanase (GH16 family)|nr:glycoside hydrolase family 16 protein [Planctomycetaceae bacterium]
MKHVILLTGLFFVFATTMTMVVFSSEPPKPFSGGSGKFTKLVWSDEFDGNGLPNPEKWGYETGYVRNKEQQYYTNARLDNAEVKDGLLVITAKKDDFQNGNKTYPVTSASVISKGKGFWNRGRIEVRAKVPSSLGTWPAIWMLPNDFKQGWPLGGEIDIMEHVGFAPKEVHFNIHVRKNHPRPEDKEMVAKLKKVQFGATVPIGDVNVFHVYAIEMFDDRIDFYFDHQKVHTYENLGEGEMAWNFDKPFYLILNLAFGGSWGGAKGIDESSLPQQFQIDYVRVWQ